MSKAKKNKKKRPGAQLIKPQPPFDWICPENISILAKNDQLPPRTRTEDIEKELSTIYLEDEENVRPDMTRLEQAKHSTFKKILIGGLVFLSVLAGISALGFFFFGQPKGNFTGEQITLSIDGPNEVKSGELVTYTIRYRNDSDVPLGTASLEMRLPDSFHLQTSDPEMTDKNTWKIGSMPPRGEGRIEIDGLVLAQIDKEFDLQGIITYRPANFNSEFQKVVTKTIKAVGSVLNLEIRGPDKILPGDLVELTILYKNDSDSIIDNAVVTADWPAEFIPESSEPVATNETFSRWNIGSLLGQTSNSITVTGTFASESQGQINLPIALGFITTADTYVEQVKTELVAEVLQGQLVAALVLNGKPENQTAYLGEDLRYSVSYRNTGEASLGNVEIAVVISITPEEADLVLWNELEDEAGGTLKQNRIGWTSRQIKSLARLEAGDEGLINFSLPLVAELSSATASNLVINSWVETLVESIDGDVVNRSAKSQPVEIKIMSDTELTVGARFFSEDGLALGSGVIPPEVGRETTYIIGWRITNSLHELSNLRLTAKLPDNVEWNGESEVSAGDLRYDAAERKMIWTLNWLPKTVSSVNINFEAKITPTEDQRNRIPTLVDATVFEARDNSAEATILLSQPPLTTSLNDDPRALGKGRVR